MRENKQDNGVWRLSPGMKKMIANSKPTCEDEQEWSESHRGFPAYVKMENLLVEWVCGKGLTVLPPTTSQQ